MKIVVEIEAGKLLPAILTEMFRGFRDLCELQQRTVRDVCDLWYRMAAQRTKTGETPPA